MPVAVMASAATLPHPGHAHPGSRRASLSARASEVVPRTPPLHIDVSGVAAPGERPATARTPSAGGRRASVQMGGAAQRRMSFGAAPMSARRVSYRSASSSSLLSSASSDADQPAGDTDLANLSKTLGEEAPIRVALLTHPGFPVRDLAASKRVREANLRALQRLRALAPEHGGGGGARSDPQLAGSRVGSAASRASTRPTSAVSEDDRPVSAVKGMTPAHVTGTPPSAKATIPPWERPVYRRVLNAPRMRPTRSFEDLRRAQHALYAKTQETEEEAGGRKTRKNSAKRGSLALRVAGAAAFLNLHHNHVFEHQLLAGERIQVGAVAAQASVAIGGGVVIPAGRLVGVEEEVAQALVRRAGIARGLGLDEEAELLRVGVAEALGDAGELRAIGVQVVGRQAAAVATEVATHRLAERVGVHDLDRALGQRQPVGRAACVGVDRAQAHGPLHEVGACAAHRADGAGLGRDAGREHGHVARDAELGQGLEH